MIINPSSEIAKRMVDYLLENPMSAREFAELVDISQPTVGNILSGKYRMNLQTQMKLEKFLRRVENDRKQIF
jgi:DNA-binding XRE family transcriptional regulator